MFDSFQKRSHESPMDWEWQTQGPVDPKTPFPLFKPQQGQKSRFYVATWREVLTAILESFESPQPASSFMGASTPAPAFRNPSFTTPRKPFDQDLFSEVSGPESSPAENTDIDDTPETRTSTAMAAFSLSNSERQPLFSRYGAEFRGSSPGRVDQRRGKLGQSIVNKVRKRKRIDRDHSLALGTRRGSYSDSEDDEDTARPRIRNIHKGKGENWFSQALTAINSKPDLPDILSKYAQFFVNACVATLSIYVLYGSVMTVKADIGRATQKEMSSILDEMDVCAREYTTNGCHNKGTLPPALITVCEKWDTCMNRDPSNVGVATLGAHTYGEILNSFVDPISFKSMVCYPTSFA